MCFSDLEHTACPITSKQGIGLVHHHLPSGDSMALLQVVLYFICLVFGWLLINSFWSWSPPDWPFLSRFCHINSHSLLATLLCIYIWEQSHRCCVYLQNAHHCHHMITSKTLFSNLRKEWLISWSELAHQSTLCPSLFQQVHQFLQSQWLHFSAVPPLPKDIPVCLLKGQYLPWVTCRMRPPLVFLTQGQQFTVPWWRAGFWWSSLQTRWKSLSLWIYQVLLLWK